MTVTSVPNNPNFDGSLADHFLCTMSTNRRSDAFYYSKGISLRVPSKLAQGWHAVQPTISELLSCLVSDAHAVVDRSTSEFCADMGYDDDSRKAHRIYKTIKRNTSKLRALVGAAAFRELMSGTVDGLD